MAASNSDTPMKGAGQAAEETARETGRTAAGLYEQAKATASEAYDSASDMAHDALARAQDDAADLDAAVSAQVGRHPKAMVALSIGIGFALGVLCASMRRPEPDSWYDRLDRLRRS